MSARCTYMIGKKKCKKNRVDGSEFCTCHRAIMERNAISEPMPQTRTNYNDYVPIPMMPIIDDEDMNYGSDDSRSESAETQSKNKNDDSHIASLLSQIAMLERTNFDLVIQMDQLRIAAIASKPVDINKKAKMLYYHDMKKNEDFIKIVRVRLQYVQMYIDDKHIPWQLIKAATDTHFDSLSDQEKQGYSLKANAKKDNKK